MIGVEELGRRVYAEMTNDHGVESALREALAKQPALDEFDRFGYAIAFVLAWASVRAESPELTDSDAAEAATATADLSMRAQNTVGGWDAMAAGEPGKDITVLEWLNSIPTAPKKPEPGVTA